MTLNDVHSYCENQNGEWNRGYALDVIPHVRTDIRHFEWQDSSMGKSCCAVGCVNRYRKGCGLSFYRFPTDRERRARWIAAVDI